MIDITLTHEHNALIKAQQLRNAAKKCYNKKIKNDSEFYAAEKERVKVYKRERYKNDPVFAEKMRERSKQAYYKKKASVSNE